MPRDYKPAARRRKRDPRTPAWVWLSAGFVLGVGISLLALVSGALPERLPLAATGGAGDRSGAGPARTAAGETRGEPEREKPRFEFYTMLPEMEVAVSEEEIETAKADSARSQPTPFAGTYVLQVGSFRRYAEADRMKATLALLGLEAQIQTVSIDGEETWHRVRLGPYSDVARLNEARDRLYENDLEAIVLKQKDSG